MTQTDNDALVPCPFCGGAATVTTPLGFGNIRAIECTDSKCGAVGPWRSYENAAVVAWNTRAALRSPAPVVDGHLGVFGHHPEAGIDYEIEIEALIGMAYDRLTGMREQPDLEERIRKAMEFRVMETPLELRWLSQKFNGTREIYTKMPDCIARLEATRPQPAQDEEREAFIRLLDAADRYNGVHSGGGPLQGQLILAVRHAYRVLGIGRTEKQPPFSEDAITALRQHSGESGLREALEKCCAQFEFYAKEHAEKAAKAKTEWDDARYWGNVDEQAEKQAEFQKRAKQTAANQEFVELCCAALGGGGEA